MEASWGIRVVGDMAVEIEGVTEDSREVGRGFLFASLRGARTDGARFIDEAIGRGAAAVLAADENQDGRAGVPFLFSKEPRKALAQIVSAFHGHPSDGLKMVGVTGTNGKTTTTYLIKQLLQSQGIPTGWIGTVQYCFGSTTIPSSHTTPGAVRLQSLLAQMRSAGCKAVSMEVSSHALDQHRVVGVAWDVAILTNVTGDHLDYHGTFDAYLRSKQRLFELLGDSHKSARMAVVNADDPSCGKITSAIKAPVWTYGIDQSADVMAKAIRWTSKGTHFDLRTPLGKATCLCPLFGRFNVSNALAAVAGGMALGMKLNSLVKGLATVIAPVGRMEFLPSDLPFRVVVDYAHTDDALRHVLTTVREFTSGRVLVVFGCGGDRDRSKRPRMGRVAEELADFSWLSSDNPRCEDPHAILRQIEEGFTRKDKYALCEDRESAIRQAIAMALPGDLVLIAGKGHEESQIGKDGPAPFSDKAVAWDAMKVLCKS